MTTQTLETIPEEAVAPATPARVTSEPATAKNPGRVASGKRLAERNRLAREAKKKTSRSTETKYKHNYKHDRTIKHSHKHDRTIKQQHKHWLLYSGYWWFDCLRFGRVLPT